jgi:hypothetical protein
MDTVGLWQVHDSEFFQDIYGLDASELHVTALFQLPNNALDEQSLPSHRVGVQSSFGEESWENPKPGQSQLVPMPSITNTYKSRP